MSDGVESTPNFSGITTIPQYVGWQQMTSVEISICFRVLKYGHHLSMDLATEILLLFPWFNYFLYVGK
jgi:hypothetical protein